MSLPQRKVPQDKRHTKPCKYYQAMRCPKSAEECNFAHILAEPLAHGTKNVLEMPSIGAHGGFQWGTRANGRVPIISPVPHPHTVGRNPIYIPVYGSYMPYYHGWPYHHDMARYAHPQNKKIPAEIKSAVLSVPHIYENNDSTPSVSQTEESSECAVVETEDPKYNEHSHPHQSKVSVEEDYAIIHIPPLYNVSDFKPNILTDHQHFLQRSAPPCYDKQCGSAGLNIRTIQTRNPSRRKLAHIKTKPCKFYPSEKGCPNGDSCTFIHDGSDALPPNTPPRTHAPASPADDASTNTPKTAPDQGGSMTKKNFYPISWRVIGGGVLVGSNKNGSNLAGNDKLSVDDTSMQHDPGDCKVFDSDTESIDDTTTPITPTEFQRCDSKDGTPAKTPTRPRSSSIPSTPMSAIYKVDNLFSAESPGVL